MQAIDLLAIPNQEFTITLEGVRFDLEFRTFDDITYVTITANDIEVVSGSRCVAGFMLIPYQYLEGTAGNFTFNTPNDEYPNYVNFGTSHTLVYATSVELAAIRAAA